MKFLPENPFNSEKGKWEAGRHFANPGNGRISGIWGRRDYPTTDAGICSIFSPTAHRSQYIGPPAMNTDSILSVSGQMPRCLCNFWFVDLSHSKTWLSEASKRGIIMSRLTHHQVNQENQEKQVKLSQASKQGIIMSSPANQEPPAGSIGLNTPH